MNSVTYALKTTIFNDLNLKKYNHLFESFSNRVIVFLKFRLVLYTLSFFSLPLLFQIFHIVHKYTKFKQTSTNKFN